MSLDCIRPVSFFPLVGVRIAIIRSIALRYERRTNSTCVIFISIVSSSSRLNRCAFECFFHILHNTLVFFTFTEYFQPETVASSAHIEHKILCGFIGASGDSDRIRFMTH